MTVEMMAIALHHLIYIFPNFLTMECNSINRCGAIVLSTVIGNARSLLVR